MPQLLVLDGKDDDVRFYDATTRKLVKRVKVGAKPTAIALAPNGRSAYVVNGESGDLSVLDVIRMTEVRRVDLDPVRAPVGLACTPDGTRLLVTCAEMKTIYSVETRTHKVTSFTQPLPDVPGAVAIARIGSVAFTALKASGNVLAFDPRTLQAYRTVDVPREPDGLDVTPDGRWLLAACRGANQLAVLNTSDAALAFTVPVGPQPVRVAGIKNNQALVATHGSNGVDVVSLDERKVVQTIICGAKPVYVCAGRGDRVAYVASEANRNISVIDLEKKKVQDVLEAGSMPHAMAFRA